MQQHFSMYLGSVLKIPFIQWLNRIDWVWWLKYKLWIGCIKSYTTLNFCYYVLKLFNKSKWHEAHSCTSFGGVGRFIRLSRLLGRGNAKAGRTEPSFDWICKFIARKNINKRSSLWKREMTTPAITRTKSLFSVNNRSFEYMNGN